MIIIEAALLPGERTDLVSTNRLEHGWAYQQLANGWYFFSFIFQFVLISYWINMEEAIKYYL